MSKKVIIKISVALVIIIVVSIGTLFIMSTLGGPKDKPSDTDVKETESASARFYSDAETALKNGDSKKAKELFEQAKDSYSKENADEVADRLANIESHLQAIKLQNQNSDQENIEPTPLAESGQ